MQALHGICDHVEPITNTSFDLSGKLSDKLREGIRPRDRRRFLNRENRNISREIGRLGSWRGSSLLVPQLGNDCCPLFAREPRRNIEEESIDGLIVRGRNLVTFGDSGVHVRAHRPFHYEALSAKVQPLRCRKCRLLRMIEVTAAVRSHHSAKPSRDAYRAIDAGFCRRTADVIHAPILCVPSPRNLGGLIPAQHFRSVWLAPTAPTSDRSRTASRRSSPATGIPLRTCPCSTPARVRSFPSDRSWRGRWRGRG